MSSPAPPPREIKILMLHGYTQSGPSFRAKTRALEKLITRTLAPHSLLPVLFYPTAPNRLLLSDIPGYEPRITAAGDDDAAPEFWAWFRKDEASGTYRFFDEGMAAVARAIRDARGVDALCGFSQGGAVATLAAAAMEPRRPVPEGAEGRWARELRAANEDRPLSFAVSYSGFFAPPAALAWCYSPKINTPVLNVVGSLDTIVEESRTQGLIDRCEHPTVVVHPGGHHVPVAKQWVLPLASYILQHAQRSERRGGEDEVTE